MHIVAYEHEYITTRTIQIHQIPYTTCYVLFILYRGVIILDKFKKTVIIKHIFYPTIGAYAKMFMIISVWYCIVVSALHPHHHHQIYHLYATSILYVFAWNKNNMILFSNNNIYIIIHHQLELLITPWASWNLIAIGEYLWEHHSTIVRWLIKNKQEQCLCKNMASGEFK